MTKNASGFRVRGQDHVNKVCLKCGAIDRAGDRAEAHFRRLTGQDLPGALSVPKENQ